MIVAEEKVMVHSRSIQNNIGVTLVEIVVVVMIIGILSTAVIVSLSSVMRANTTRAAVEISSIMNEARIESMGRIDNSVQLEIAKSGENGAYSAEIVRVQKDDSGNESRIVTESKEVASGSVAVSAAKAGKDAVAIDSGKRMIITFKKSSGALNYFFVVSGDEETVTGTGYDSIVLESGKKSVVRIAENTGRSYVE